MSGAGGYGAGQSPAGQNGIPAAVLAATIRPALGLYLDLSTMDFPLDANGRYVEIHSVDHLALMLIGPTNPLWKELPITDEADMTRRADEIVRARWQKLIAQGDVADIQVRAWPRDDGRIGIYIRYRNLRDADPQNPYRTVEI